MIKRAAILLLIIVFTTFYSKLQAHPHVFIISQISISYNDDGIAGFEVKWTFDRMFTQIMLDEYDENSDGEFDKTEVVRLYKTAFVNLKKSDYFTHIYIENQLVKIKKVTNFKASIKEGEMLYSFFIPIKIDLDKSATNINIYCYDDSYYMDIMMDEDAPLLSSNSANYLIDYTIEEDANKAFYFEQIYPQVVRIKTQNK